MKEIIREYKATLHIGRWTWKNFGPSSGGWGKGVANSGLRVVPWKKDIMKHVNSKLSQNFEFPFCIEVMGGSTRRLRLLKYET